VIGYPLIAPAIKTYPSEVAWAEDLRRVAPCRSSLFQSLSHSGHPTTYLMKRPAATKLRKTAAGPVVPGSLYAPARLLYLKAEGLSE